MIERAIETRAMMRRFRQFAEEIGLTDKEVHEMLGRPPALDCYEDPVTRTEERARLFVALVDEMTASRGRASLPDWFRAEVDGDTILSFASRGRRHLRSLLFAARTDGIRQDISGF